MNAPPQISVIVVSHGRPGDLGRCLRGLEQLLYPSFEIVVVADAAGLATVDRMGWAGRIKTVQLEEPNISLARNRGIEQAAGEIVAFIDDDAVPEPTWLSALADGFSGDAVAAAGGFVRGRNGISFQWKARAVDHYGQATPLAVDPLRPTVLSSRPNCAIKTEGTNMAFRRDDLAALGGFDPAYRFYLDETDLNLRLSALGRNTAIVPLAEVHHGFAPSPRRRADRVPRTLFEIGASTAVFQRRHGAAQDIFDQTRQRQRFRLLQHMIDGRIEPAAVEKLLETLAEGFEEGRARALTPLPPLGRSQSEFLGFAAFPKGPTQVLSGRPHQAARLKKRAQQLVAEGQRVTLFLFSPTALFHHVGFHDDGYWLQTGGIFGRSRRDQPLVQAARFQTRLRREIARVSPQRGFYARLGGGHDPAGAGKAG